ncbi:hypothetical protein ACF3NX_13645 (plasmid) [Acetobacter orientalis]|uniref:hypothetical protein n=1 Tax=Acetobacter orientalis TaxID=146474 RepID=UPI003865D20C
MTGAAAKGVVAALVGVTLAVFVAGVGACFVGRAGGIPRSGGVMPELFAVAPVATAAFVPVGPCCADPGDGPTCRTDAPTPTSAIIAAPAHKAFDLATRRTSPGPGATEGTSCALTGGIGGLFGFGGSVWATSAASVPLLGLRNMVTDPVWGSVLIARAPMVAP